MVFNSTVFLIFFVVVTTAFFALPFRRRWPMLLAASYVFYAWWDVRFLILRTRQATARPGDRVRVGVPDGAAWSIPEGDA